MKSIYFLLCIVVFCETINAQFGEQQIISNTATNARNVVSADINGDGFIDAIAHFENAIAWYKNLDGEGNFGVKNIILTDITENYKTIIPRDMDSDSDIDLLLHTSSEIVWIENMNGLGDFEIIHSIFESEDFLLSIYLQDINGDSFEDIICANYDHSPELIWFENINNSGSFLDKEIIDNNVFPLFRDIVAGDIDGDGDNDILIGKKQIEGIPGIALYKNIDGNGNFSDPYQVYPYFFLEYEAGIHLADIDLDGDNDIVFFRDSDFGSTTILLIENLDGIGEDWMHQNILGDGNINSSALADIDNDGFIDIVYSTSPSNEEDSLLWVKNYKGVFKESTLITELVVGPNKVDLAFINSDNKIDLLSSSGLDNKIAWYENLGILSTQNFNLSKTNIYPNPTKDYIQIETNNIITKVEVFNVLGERVASKYQKKLIDLSTIQSGIYFIKIEFDSGLQDVFKIIKQ